MPRPSLKSAQILMLSFQFILPMTGDFNSYIFNSCSGVPLLFSALSIVGLVESLWIVMFSMYKTWLFCRIFIQKNKIKQIPKDLSKLQSGPLKLQCLIMLVWPMIPNFWTVVSSEKFKTKNSIPLTNSQTLDSNIDGSRNILFARF